MAEEPYLEDVEDLPEHKRRGKWVDRVEEFRMNDKDKQRVHYEENNTRNAAYSGLLNAIRRRDYRDEVRVTERGDKIFLVTYEYWNENIRREE